MRICIVTSVYALSDTDRHAAFLVESTRNLVARGHQVEVFAPSYEGCSSHTVEGVPVHRFRYFPARWENLTHGQGAPNRIRNPLYIFIAAFYILFGLISLVRLCRRQRFDVLHVHWPFPHGIWGCAASRLAGVPMVLNFHGAELALVQRFGFVAFFLRRAIACAQGVICNSSFNAAKAALYGATSPQVIPFGTTITVQPRAVVEARPVRNLLFVGRLIDRKGVDIFLGALPTILARVPVVAHVVGEGPLMARYRQQVGTLGVASTVIFHGVVSNEQLQSLYTQADAFVLPSIVNRDGDTEGLGVVLIEAMAFGCPVVASAVGGIPDVVVDGETGLLVPPASPEALAAAVLRVLEDAQLAARLGRGGSARVQEYFEWGRITDSVESVYRDAVLRFTGGRAMAVPAG